MRPTQWSLRALAGVVVALAVAAPASAQAPTLDGVGIAGDPVVGSPLQAVIAGTVDPAALSYRWCHQRDGRADKCSSGRPIGTSRTYVPGPGDVGHRLLVRAEADIDTFDVEVMSAPTAPVVATRPPTPPPTTPPPPTTTPPLPPPTTTPPLGGTVPPPVFGSSGTTPASTAPNSSEPAGIQVPTAGSAPVLLPYLDPFPVVRVRGFVAARGARISLLRVSAPRRATVRIRCVGDGCPIRRRTRHAGRIRALERFLPAGLRITVRVTRPGHVGKYVRLVIRARRPPSRHDACLLPGSRRAVSCSSG